MSKIQILIAYQLAKDAGLINYAQALAQLLKQHANRS